MLGMRQIIREVQPAVMLVHGDTTTCLAAGLAAFYQQIPLAHVEAGLRTGDMRAPFPEEANRTLVAPLCQFLFAPTQLSRQNLLEESHDPAKISVTGNTVIDALLWVRDKVRQYPQQQWQQQFGQPLCSSIHAQRKLVLITGHRRENFGQGFTDLCGAIHALATKHPGWDFIYPVHLNPNVQQPVNNILGDLDNVHLIAPLDYLPFVWLMDKSDIILTDSGGIPGGGAFSWQTCTGHARRDRAARSRHCRHRKTCGHKPTKHCAGRRATTDQSAGPSQAMARAINPYGDGKAAERIVQRLENHFAGSGEVAEFTAAHA